MKSIKPHSRPGKLAVVDGRSAEARRMKEIRAELAEHVGGKPSIAQSLLIERIAILVLRMELMDKRALRPDGDTDAGAKQYLGWNNAVSRMLRQLGLKGVASRQPTLAEYLSAGREAA